MTDPLSEMQRKLAALRVRYAATLKDKLGDIKLQLERCKRLPLDKEQLMLLYQQLHRLGGSAGTFGFFELGAAARWIEQDIDKWLEAGQWTTADVERLEQRLAELDSLLPVKGN